MPKKIRRRLSPIAAAELRAFVGTRKNASGQQRIVKRNCDHRKRKRYGLSEEKREAQRILSLAQWRVANLRGLGKRKLASAFRRLLKPSQTPINPTKHFSFVFFTEKKALEN